MEVQGTKPAGRPVGAAGVRDQVVAVRLTGAERAQLDAMRGNLSRSEWLRWLLMVKIREERAKSTQNGG